MTVKIFSAPYYYTLARDIPGEACRLLTKLAGEEVNLLAFNALPVGPDETQLIIYPFNTTWLADVARHTGLKLSGPHHAFIIQGDDMLLVALREGSHLFESMHAVGGEEVGVE